VHELHVAAPTSTTFKHMNITRTAIPDLLMIEPKFLGDSRGFFAEMYQAERYSSAGLASRFVQDNLSRSVKGTLRGLHLQNPHPQGKLVTVLSGAVLDVAVDLRLHSPTFGQHVAVRLDDHNRRQFWVPRGFGHGFVVLSDTADFFYKCDNYYSPGDELVLKWNDPVLGIDWGCATPLLSQRDAAGRTLSELEGLLPEYGTV
jgi:dTDP-4-dehydrorhamnose 3,5-epimerase